MMQLKRPKRLPYMTVQEASDYLRKHLPMTRHRLGIEVKCGIGPQAYIWGKRLLFTKRSLNIYLGQQKVAKEVQHRIKAKRAKRKSK